MLQMQAPLQAFRRALVARTDRIRRGCMSDSVTIGEIERDRFVVTVRWRGPNGKQGAHRKNYVASALFAVGPFGVKLRRPPCRLVDDLVREVHGMRRL